MTAYRGQTSSVSGCACLKPDKLLFTSPFPSQNLARAARVFSTMETGIAQAQKNIQKIQETINTIHPQVTKRIFNGFG